ncbi:(2Fe-2S) ferredoxin domain-containing protein [Serpentinicella sp. ANB-PHB4]|uniref:(2Fe-2S) ferredoxin domain-containing protein n=1 Tax=Serpentinicella sp. ANB-PHB4 TaxID=3074076 RepID=UPI002863884D|nr:(2Fe-2S) ferredoxin domain-containing protein [Serpentinicella sp. ANB-PHB4]MDR5659371.1 (2Fe-2S) ferredoxin domain-containing protein [Serpentinicella sp. ANB-PHB4]
MKSIADLEKIRKEALDKINLRKENKGTRIVVGMATCGIASGARPVMMALIEEVKKRNLDNVVVTQTGCIGACNMEPMIEVYKEGNEKVTYIKMTPEKAKQVILEHIVNGNEINEFMIQG